MDQPKPSDTRVSTIKLDDATRKKILADLGVQGTVDWIPESIQVARVHASAIGAKITRANPWVLVMV
jgi:hypothetical protein